MGSQVTQPGYAAAAAVNVAVWTPAILRREASGAGGGSPRHGAPRLLAPA